MKHIKKIKKIFESFKTYKKQDNLFLNKRVIDVQYIRDKDAKEMIMEYAREKVNHNKSYFTFYVCGEVKELSEVINKDNIVIDPEDPESDYVYERGDEPITDFLLDNGANIGEEVIFLIWW